MKCKKCNREKVIVNKFFGLCLECNNERLHGNKYGAQRTPIKKRSEKRRKSNITPHIVPKKKNTLKKDEAFYEKCFNQSNHRCEECGIQLNERFRDDNGVIIARFRYSHIIPKSIANDLRYDIRNINHLCLKCHMKWENGDRESMTIYNINKKRFPQYF